MECTCGKTSKRCLYYGPYKAPVKFNGTTQQPSVRALRPALIYKCFLGKKRVLEKYTADKMPVYCALESTLSTAAQT